MVRLSLLFLPLLLIPARSAASPGEGDPPGGADDRASVQTSADPFEAPGLTPATLTAMRANPSSWLGRRARVVLQLRGEAPRWNPYLTRFGPADYVRFEAWCDRVHLWDRGAYDDPAPYLFAPRGSVAELGLRSAQPHERYEAVVVVRETFLGEPWVEVERVRRQPEMVTEGTILHAVRALELHAEGRCDLALEQFGRAGAASLPAHAREELDRLETACATGHRPR